MRRSYPCSTIITLAVFALPFLINRIYAEESLFIPVPDDEIVRLDKPTRWIALPEAPENARGPDRSFELDPTWRIERAVIAPDGQSAYLLAYTIDQQHHTPAYHYTKATIRKLNLLTGKETARYILPEPFASNEWPGAFGTGSMGLEVSAGGDSIITAYMPHQLRIRDEAHLRYNKGPTFFRWDKQNPAIITERILDAAGCYWQMLPSKDLLLVWKWGRDTYQIEGWDTQDLSVMSWVEVPRCPAGDAKKDGVTTIPWRLIDYDEQDDTLHIIHRWRVLASENRTAMRREWHQQYDTQTGQPIGPATRFENVHTVAAQVLRGQHLLLYEQDKTGLDHRQTAHIWNVHTREHVASIDTTHSSKSYVNRLDLTRDGAEVIYENRLLDLRTFKWSVARTGGSSSGIKAFTPDGRHLIIIRNPDISKTEASTSLEVYDLK